MPAVNHPPVFPPVLGGTTLGPHQEVVGKKRCWGGSSRDHRSSRRRVRERFVHLSGMRNQSATHLPRVEQLCCDAHHLISPTASLFPFPARLGCQKYKEVHSTFSSQAAGCVASRNWLDVQRTGSPEKESFFPLFLDPREHKRQHSLTP